MFNLEILDQLIAIVVVLLVLSLIVQSIQAAIKKFFRIKSKELEQSLVHLFYYILDKNALDTMQTTPDRLPVLKALCSVPPLKWFFGQHSKHLARYDPQVESLFEAIGEEVQRAGRITPGGRPAIESLSKEDLIKFIGNISITKLRDKLKGKDAANFTRATTALAATQPLIEEFTIKYGKLLDQTPLGPMVAPITNILAKANQFLITASDETTLSDLARLGKDEANEARKLISALPASMQHTIEHFEQNAQQEAAAALQKLKNVLAPVSEDLSAIAALPSQLGQLKTKIETWYDTVMKSFEERYTRSMRSFAIAISALVVITLNANLFDIYRQVSSDKAKRDLIVQSSDKIVQALEKQRATPNLNDQQMIVTVQQWAKDSQAEIEANVSLYTALGFSGPRWMGSIWGKASQMKWQQALLEALETLFGWTLMTLLLSVGAPFWQDTLESLFGIKNFLRQRGGESK